MSSTSVTVIGSYNVGLFFRGGHLPAIGETVIGDEFYEGAGGKGSNQALAASRFGAITTFIGRIGLDRYGDDAVATYKAMGVDARRIIVDPTTHTGISVILIDDVGRNMIVVVPGANANLCDSDLDRHVDVLQASRIVGFQLENRLDVVAYGIRLAHGMGVLTFLDPAPAVALALDLYPEIDFIKPNETEAAALTGLPVTTLAEAERAAQWFVDRGVGTAIVTLGERGVTVVSTEGPRHYEAPPVDSIDTTGAGDTFAGALLAQIGGGATVDDAVQFANHAAALSVTRLGVVSAIPETEEVLAFMHGRRASLPTDHPMGPEG